MRRLAKMRDRQARSGQLGSCPPSPSRRLRLAVRMGCHHPPWSAVWRYRRVRSRALGERNDITGSGRAARTIGTTHSLTSEADYAAAGFASPQPPGRTW